MATATAPASVRIQPDSSRPVETSTSRMSASDGARASGAGSWLMGRR